MFGVYILYIYKVHVWRHLNMKKIRNLSEFKKQQNRNLSKDKNLP